MPWIIETGGISSLPVGAKSLGTFVSTTTQSPTGGGAAGAITVTYGPGGTTTGGEFSVDAGGIITLLDRPKQYLFNLILRVSRSGVPGVVRMVARMMYAADGVIGNGVQVGTSFGVEINDGDSVWRETFAQYVTPDVGGKIWLEMARDESGATNDGAIGTYQPSGTIATWNPISSAELEISEIMTT